MKKTKYDLGAVTSLTIDITCDLKLVGWDKPEIFTEADEDVLTVTAEGSSAKIECECDCIVSVPNSIRIDRLHAGGDASIIDFKGIIDNAQIDGDFDISRSGGISVRKVDGDLQIHQMTENCSIGHVDGDLVAGSFKKNLLITSVDGDCMVSDVQGEMEIKSVGGDCQLDSIMGGATLQNVGGDCSIDGVVKGLNNTRIGGDLQSPNLSGDISIFAGGDILARVASTNPQKVFLQAGGDITLHFDEKPSAKFELKSAPESTTVDFDGTTETYTSAKNEFTLGEGASLFKLTTGGEILLTQKPYGERRSHHSFQQFDSTFERVMEKLKQRIDLDERIAEKAELISERVSERAEEISRRVENKVNKAMERLERKLDKEKFARDFSSAGITPSYPGPDIKAPISDEEKTLILKMLQEKKITPEEAEKLFEALENKNE